MPPTDVSPARGRAISPGMRRALTLLLPFLSTLVFFALLECAARLAGVRPLSEDPRHAQTLWYRRCQAGWGDPARMCDIEPAATNGTKLLVTLGGSTVQGHPVGRVIPFPEQMQKLLDQRHPGQYSVRNLGWMCKDSIYVRRCGERALAAGPDILIVYSGHNSYTNWAEDDARERIFMEEHAWLYDLDAALARSSAYTLLAKVALRFGSGPSATAPPSEQRVRETRRVILDKVTSDFTTLIEHAERRGTDVILVTLVSNLYEYPLRRERWDEATRLPARSPRELRWRTQLERGIAAYRAGRYEEALAAFKRARDEEPFGRAPSELNARIRELAARHPRVHLVDFEKELERIGLRDGIGCNFFGEGDRCDQFHPNQETLYRMADAILREVIRVEVERDIARHRSWSGDSP